MRFADLTGGLHTGPLLLCACLLSAAAAPAGAMDSRPEVFFAEPGSGRKVAAYEVDLPVDRDRHERFAIPRDCNRVTEHLAHGDVYTGSIVDRRVWHKVESDCRYHGFLNRHPMHGIADHVSDYDFWNARLGDLPIDLHCTEAGANAGRCDPTATDAFGMLRYFPLAEPAADDAPETTESPCRLRDGLFHGHLYVGPGGIRCEASAAQPSLRLIAVDYADINGDHVLDAVLRFVPIGPGPIRGPLILPLTRFSDDERFSVPQPLFSPPANS